jgi:hypothetical protein
MMFDVDDLDPSCTILGVRAGQRNAPVTVVEATEETASVVEVERHKGEVTVRLDGLDDAADYVAVLFAQRTGFARASYVTGRIPECRFDRLPAGDYLLVVRQAADPTAGERQPEPRRLKLRPGERQAVVITPERE